MEALNRFLRNSGDFYKTNGIWYSKTRSEISYPEEGSDLCYQLEDISFWFNHRSKCIISLVKKFSEGETFFDIGGGNGIVTKSLENANIESVLIEPGRDAVTNARKRNIKQIICCTLQDLTPLQGKLPAIGAFDVIEHIQDDSGFMAEVYKMLREDGLFYITVPAFNFLWSDDDVFAGHYRRYNLRKIRSVIKKNNFEIIYSTYFFSILVPPLLIFRTLMSKLGIRKKASADYREHKQRPGILGRMLDYVWKWELSRIKKSKAIPFGTSCLIVCRKK